MPRALVSKNITSMEASSSPVENCQPPAIMNIASNAVQAGLTLPILRVSQVSCGSQPEAAVGFAALGWYWRTARPSGPPMVKNEPSGRPDEHSTLPGGLGPSCQLVASLGRKDDVSWCMMYTPREVVMLATTSVFGRSLTAPRSHWAVEEFKRRQSVESGFPPHDPPHVISSPVVRRNVVWFTLRSGSGAIWQVVSPNIMEEVVEAPPVTRTP